jgi:preprotein translocase SecE subunit
MASENDGKVKRSDGAGAGAALADKERKVSEVTLRGEGSEKPFRDRNGSGAPTSTGSSRPAGGGFFDMYKPGQGYYTRVWSGVAFGVMVCWLAYFFYEKLALYGKGATTKYLQVGVATAIILGFGLVGYWMLALNRKICDFLIATEGEMKKVNWTNRKEIIGSTKVVVIVLCGMGLLLFVVDIFFMLFFNSIGILKGEGLFDSFKGIF